MAHKGLWQQLDKLDREETSNRAKCQYLRDAEHYVVTMLEAEYVVNPQDREIVSVRPDLPPQPAGFLQQLCLLTYLINAQDMPPANKLVRAEALPGGQFFFRGIHNLPTKKLEKAFGKHPEDLHQIAKRFNAKKCEFGDASVQLNILSRIPLTIIIWKGDEEFDARATILFDQTAASHLPLDALWTAVNLAVEALVRAARADI
jgi:hypothetical protein